MRDLNRIDKIQNKITELWNQFPDMRYFQLVSYVASAIEYEGDLFFLEDDDFEKRLDKIMEVK